jgi:hypothetical protein
LETKQCTWEDTHEYRHVPQFHRYYVAPSYLKQVWTNGLRIMMFDASLTCTGQFKHTILFAVTLDGNHQHCVVAFAVVDVETGDNWFWFLQKLMVDFPGIDVLLADHDKGIAAHELQATLATANIRFSQCVRHVGDDCPWAQGIHGVNDDYKKKVIALAKCCSIDTYNLKLHQLQNINPCATEWLDRQKGLFATYLLLDHGKRRFGHVLIDAAEYINAAIQEIREQPILDLAIRMLQWMHTNLRERNEKVTERVAMSLTEYAHDELALLVGEGRRLEVTITNRLNRRYTADVQQEAHGSLVRYVSVTIDTENFVCTCPCRHAEEFGYPCQHGFAVLCHINENTNNPAWFDRVYHMETYRTMYNVLVPNTPTLGHLTVNEMLPPDFRLTPNTPQPRRYESRAVKKPRECSFCGTQGHSYMTCTTPNTAYIYPKWRGLASSYATREISKELFVL